MYPQKWNKYAYVQNNPLGSIDPDGLDDYKVFLTVPEGSTGNWGGVAQSVASNGHTMQIYSGGAATIQAYNKALSDPKSRVVFVGHTRHDPTTNVTNSLQLANGDSRGTASTSQTFDMSTDPPTLGAKINQNTTVSANSVAVFGCDSISLSSQYTDAGLFVAMDSGPDHLSSLQAMGMAAASWVTADARARPDPSGTSTFVGPVDPLASANAAFNQNAVSVPGVYTDNGDKVVEVRKDSQR